MLDFHYYVLVLLQIGIHNWRTTRRNYMLAYPVSSKHYNSLIQISKRWKKYPTLYVSLKLGNHQFKIKEGTRDISDNYGHFFVLF